MNICGLHLCGKDSSAKERVVNETKKKIIVDPIRQLIIILFLYSSNE
jgi:hypothetical protein